MAEQKNPQAQPELSLSEQTRIRREKLTNLQAEGQNPFVITRFDWDATSQQIKDNFDAMEGKPVKVAGRLMSKRGMGKVSFCDLQDRDGRIQLYARQDEMDEEVYKKFKKFDIGDIVGVEGEAFRTQRGEMSVRAHNIILLSKSLLPLPEKFHGLQDKELRFRQRYVDLMVNPEVKKNFVIRSQFIKFMRNYLDNMGYMEVETPVLNTIAGGAAARPFITHHNTLDIDMYMRIATELPLKRLLVGGFEKVFEIGRQFRNEGMDPYHNPEFTTMEAYEAFGDLDSMMDLTEGCIKAAAEAACGTLKIEYQGTPVDLSGDWRRASMMELASEHAGEEVSFDRTRDELVAILEKNGGHAEAAWGKGKLISEIFEAVAEEKLIQPTFVIDHPLEISPLAKKHPENPELTQRFELFILGHEYGNAFTELNDPVDQAERFRAQVAAKDMGDDEAMGFDADYIRALEYGMPPAGGVGIGIDRLVMLLTDAPSIRDVLLFPHMKDEVLGDGRPVCATEKAPAEGAPAEGAPVATCAAEATSAEPSEPIDFSNVVIEPLFEDEVDFDTFSKSDFRAVKVKECIAVPKSKKLLQFTLDDGTGTDRTILSGIHAYYEPEELVGKTLIAITNLPPRKMMGVASEGMLMSAIHEVPGDDGEPEERLNLLVVDDRIPAGAKLY